MGDAQDISFTLRVDDSALEEQLRRRLRHVGAPPKSVLLAQIVIAWFLAANVADIVTWRSPGAPVWAACWALVDAFELGLFAAYCILIAICRRDIRREVGATVRYVATNWKRPTESETP